MSFFPNKPGALAGWAAGHLARYGRGVLSFSPYRPRPLAPLGPDLPATSGGRFSIRLRRCNGYSAAEDSGGGFLPVSTPTASRKPVIGSSRLPGCRSANGRARAHHG